MRLTSLHGGTGVCRASDVATSKVLNETFPCGGEVLKRVRCAFAARSAPGNAFFDGQNRAIALQNHRAARAKPLQNVCKIAWRAPRKFWQRRRSFEARSLRFCRAFGARKCVFRRPKSRDFAAKPPRGAHETIAKRVQDRLACAAQVLAASAKV